MEVDDEQAAAKTLNLIHDKEPKPEDKGKAVEPQGPPKKMKKEVAIQRPVDEAAGSSNVFSMAQWQTQMTSQVRQVAEAYHAEVSLKQEADQRYQFAE